MKPPRLSTPLASAIAALLAASSLHAATITWDASGETALQTDGAGTWDAGTNWWNGSTNVPWTSGDNAVFGNAGAGGAVTLASGTTVGTLTFNAFTGTYTLGTGTSTIILNSGSTGTITPAVVITSGNRQTAGTSVTSTNPAPTLGTQTFNTSIDFQAGSIFEWNLTANTETSEGTRSTNYDAVDTASLLNTGAEAIFRLVLNGTENFDESFWNADRSWADIFKNGGTALNIETIFGANVEYYNSADLVPNGNTTGRSFSISGMTLNWTTVPEPTSALVGLLVGAGLLRRRRN